LAAGSIRRDVKEDAPLIRRTEWSLTNSDELIIELEL
jgi:hypothetical protein